MFSEQEQNQLQSFLDNIDSVDTNTSINGKKKKLM